MTRRGTVNALQALAPGRLVSMVPQTNLERLARAKMLEGHAADSKMELTIGLKLHHAEVLKRFLEQVQNPNSPHYHQWLSPEEFTAKYGPSKKDVKRVVAFLKRHNIAVEEVSPNRLLIQTQAKTANYEHALGVRINDYRLDGRRFYSTMDAVKLPRSIVGTIANVIGLDNSARMHAHHGIVRKRARVRSVSSGAPPPSVDQYNPLQIATAYQWPSIKDSANGAGETIAILSANSAALVPNYYNDFWQAYGLSGHDVDIVHVDGDQGRSDGTIESALDIEYAGAMAPGAKLRVYLAGNRSFKSFTDMYNKLVTDNAAAVMTTSWGRPEVSGPTKTDEEIFMEAAAQGISMFAATGDSGSGDGTSYDSMADYPSSSVYVTAVSGTELKADVDGNYESETAWGKTGGAVSQLFDQPPWQVGPGVPANGQRNNADIAMNSSDKQPYVMYYQGQWISVYGTSAAAPQLASLFAIGVASNGGKRLGQSNKLLYNDVNAKNYKSDFRDVVEGCNGKLPSGEPSCATTDWDHPTGWGSPLGKSLVSHLGNTFPGGLLSGTVTDADSGAAISGAQVTIKPGGFTRRTLKNGSYEIVLPAGKYSITATQFGYESASQTVTVSDDGGGDLDFDLTAAPAIQVTGRVTDGSGHGYGLYARIKVTTPDFGQVAETWTDPATGSYKLSLPKGLAYTFDTAAAFAGYTLGEAKITADDKSSTLKQDFALQIEKSCSAPGYSFVQGFGENFNDGWPPSGWTVVNGSETSPVAWNTNSFWEKDNYTGGTGAAATAYAGKEHYVAFDTSLVSPEIPMSDLPGQPVLTYKANYQTYKYDVLDLDISLDGGPWKNVLRWKDAHGTIAKVGGGEDVRVELAPYIAQGTKHIQLRWHYYVPGMAFFYWYAQVDDVAIGSCQTRPGGLVFGQVQDANTDEGIVGAKIKADKDHLTAAITNPDDPDFPEAGYLLFVPAGKHTLTVMDRNYVDAAADVTVQKDAIKRQDFTLEAGRLTADKDRLTMHVMVNNQKHVPLEVGNDGEASAHYELLALKSSIPRGMADTGEVASKPAYGPEADLSRVTAAPVRFHPRQEPQIVSPTDGTAAGAAGSVVSSFDSSVIFYSLGVDRNASDLWLGSLLNGSYYGDNYDHRFFFDGTNTGDAIYTGLPFMRLYMADMAFDDNTGMLWQLSVDNLDGSASHICELDPKSLALTGQCTLVPSTQSERGLAYDPTSNTWYAGDFQSQTIYHFNERGNLLDSANVGLPINGLAYNPETGHLFALTSNGTSDVFVLDPAHNYAYLDQFDIEGFDNADSGAGLDYDCKGNLWVAEFGKQRVYQVRSGETGWCARRRAQWLSTAPAAGTVAVGDTATVSLAVDGSGQAAFTTSDAYLKLTGDDTPYGPRLIPVTVTWDPQHVNLEVSGESSPESVRKGGNVTYTLTVANTKADNHGAATETMLTYKLADGVDYVTAGGDAACTAPAGGSSAPVAATGGQPGVVTCDFGTLAQGASKTVTIAVKAEKAGKLTSHFAVNSREPDDSGKSALAISATVIGAADLSAKADDATLTQGSAGTLKLAVANAGPDPATGVKLKISTGANVKLQSARSGQGHCAVSGAEITCDLGEIAAGGQTNVEVSVFGTNAGTAQVTVQATTTADDTNAANDVATAQVTVKAASNGGGKSAGGGGGGALGWLALTALFGLMVATVGLKYRGRRA